MPTTAEDVRRVRALLQLRCGLPMELVLDILDEARYWIEVTREVTHRASLIDEAWSDTFSATIAYMGVSAFPAEHAADDDNQMTREKYTIREVEFLVVSHDQGWTTERTHGTYETSSWFDVSIVRGGGPYSLRSVDSNLEEHAVHGGEVSSNIYTALNHLRFMDDGVLLVPRPSAQIEPQRLHSRVMGEVTYHEREEVPRIQYQNAKEGDHAWYLQGNQVAEGPSIFDGDMIPRHRIIWGLSRWVGNQGAGSGHMFIETLQPGDWICVWARAKKRGWENHVHGVRMTLRYTIA